jgi:hypothetical protein
MWVVTSHSFKTGDPDGYDEPAASADDRRYDNPQPLAIDTAILHLRNREVQPAFRLLAGSAEPRTGPRLPQKRSWSNINQVACALRFFYGVTLGQTEPFERIVGGQKPDKLPLVLY